MAKGSQLSQLKSALSQAGLSRQSQAGSNGKKRKRTGNRDTGSDKEKKARKLEEINQRLNPFEVKVTKLKHDVGGRKLKGVTGRPGLSKQVGIEQRKKTLLVEYEKRGRVGGVVDRRFGENDPTMAPEERMLERFTRERQKASRNSAFHLEDEDELTHFGQSLSALDDFDGAGLALEEEEEDRGHINAEIVNVEHFGGFEDSVDEEPERKKSKAEVMAEVIAKSKDHKYQRQLQKQQDDDTRHQIDQDFASIRTLLFATPADPSSTGSNSIPLGKRQAPFHTEGIPPTAPEDNAGEDYDHFVRQLAFEKRAKPKDRLKTEEEVATEEKEQLEKAERARLRRMRGEEDLSDGEAARQHRRGGKAQADDLEDDFVDESGDVYGLGKGLEDTNSQGELSNGASEDSDDDEAGDEVDMEGGNDSDDEQSASERSSDTEGDQEDLVAQRTSKFAGGKGKAKELPYTFTCPASHDEFLELLEDINEADVPTVIQRIRVLHHPSLAEDNKYKLQTFCTILLEHLIYLTSPPKPSFRILSSLSTHIFSLSQSYPVSSAHAFISKLGIMQKNLARGLSRGALLPDSKTFPRAAELALMRLVGLVWSTSDLNHPVVAPTMLLMGQYLAQCRIRSLKDIASGLFLCTLFLQFQELSARFVPETINFLANTCLHLAPHSRATEDIPGTFPIPDFDANSMRLIQMQHRQSSTLEPRTLNLVQVLSDEQMDQDQAQVDLLATSFHLIGKFSKMYTSLDGYLELFQPILDILNALDLKGSSESLRADHAALRDALMRTLRFSAESRRPLLLQVHKPIPIATYVPKFDMGRSSFGKNNDPDYERNVAAKLRAAYRKEKKGALRELRKDNRFLAEEQAKRREEDERGYKARLARAIGDIQVERHEQKKMEKEKKREKRRSGRK